MMFKTYVLFALLLSAAFLSSCNLFGDGNGNPIGAETLDCMIQNDITLTDQNSSGVDYIVDCVLELRGRMTIEEGTIIEFREGAGIIVLQEGSIRAQGIGGLPVIFRGQDVGFASWKGIYISTDETTSVFDFVEIQDAGDGETFSVLADETAALTIDGRVRFSNSKINNSGGHGIWTSSELYNTSISDFSNNTFNGCKDFPLFIRTEYLAEMEIASSRFQENGRNMIGFTPEGSRMPNKVTLEKADVPYFFSADMEVVAGLNVEAGVQIKMAQGTGITATTGTAPIVMSGTSTNRISIAGDESQAGHWLGVLLTTAANHIFENVDISDGGSAPAGFNDGKANITLEFDSQLTLIDCTSSRSNSDCDVILHSFGGTPSLTDMSNGLAICEE